MESVNEQKIICKWCGQLSDLIWVHGHGQCSVCGINVDECCRGEFCESPDEGEIKPPMINSSLKHVCFDLDGTLINSYQTILKATVKTLKHLGISNNFNEEKFRMMIGHHFVDIFENLKIPVTDFEQFIKFYKSFYFEFINDSEIYPGVFEIMDYLKKNEIRISLLTTKNQEQADKIIDYFNLRKYFSYVMGRREEFKHKPSPESLLFICKELNVKPAETILVGDTELDINCGKNAEAKTCAVTYGYRTKELLLKENPDFFISELIELKNILQEE